MFGRKILCVVFSLFVVLPLAEARACKYSVRDVAFVDLREPKYRLYVYTRSDTPEAFVKTFADVAAKEFAESNVAARTVNIEKEPGDPAIEHARPLKIETYPAAVLVAPDGRALEIPLPDSAAGDPTALRNALSSVVASENRRELFEQLFDAHSVILVVEGTDAERNRLAKSWAEEAIRKVDDSLPFLPKPIANPPKLITLSRAQAEQEAVLLWSLGVDLSDATQTHFALLFGRGRKLGPNLAIPKDGKNDLFRSLAVVGQDCECGLDRSWMQGPMVPHIWTEANEARAVKALAFDPGDPLVKAEISRILSRGPSTQPGAPRATADPTLAPLGIEIIEIPIDDDEEEGPGVESQPEATLADTRGATARATAEARQTPLTPLEPAAEVAADKAVAPPVTGSGATPPLTTEADSTLLWMLTPVLIGLVVIALLGGAIILLGGKRGT